MLNLMMVGNRGAFEINTSIFLLTKIRAHILRLIWNDES